MKNLNLIEKFTLGGIAFGLVFPIIAFTFDLHIKDLPFSWSAIKILHQINPIHYIIDTAPFIISLVAYFVGRQIYAQDEKAKHTIKSQLIEINKKNEELQQRNAEKDKFFSIIAHDLRTPFISLMGLSKLMAQKFSSLSVDEMQEFASGIEKSTTNLFHFLENLLNWAKMNRGLVPFNPETILLKSLTIECVDMLIEMCKSKEIKVTYSIQKDIQVVADRNMLLLVIRNLVSNAIKFTPKGGKINISVISDNSKNAVISVKDSGIGMNAKLRLNLFQLDVKTNRKGTEGEASTGLGLLLCKEFIEKLGGNIWVESEEGKGSDFKFTIPTSTVKEHEMQTAQKQTLSV